MRKYIISIIIVLISIFFINSKANFKYNVNYFTVDRHMEELVNFKSDDRNEYVHDYIYSEVSKYNVEVTETDDYVLVEKKSKNSNAKNVAFITHYNGLPDKDKVNNNALPVSSMLSSIRSYNNIETNNNITFIFSKNDDLTLEGNVKFLSSNKKLINKFDYTFSFDTRGMSGDLYIYSSTKDNKEIIDFYRENVTSVAGSSDLSSIYEDNDQISGEAISLTTFEDSHYFFSNEYTLKTLSENTINQYANTIDELVKGAHTYNINGEKNDVIYFDYFDCLIVIDYFIFFVAFIVLSIAFAIFLFLNKNTLNFKNLILTALLSLSIILFTIIISMFPLQEILEKFTTSPTSVAHTAILYVKNSLVFIAVIALATVYGIIISKFANKRYDLAFKENIISCSIIIIFINIGSIIITQRINTIASLMFILYVITIYLIRYAKISNRVLQYTFILTILPVITYNLYLMYIIATPARLIYFATLLGIYYAIFLPTLVVKSKKKIV